MSATKRPWAICEHSGGAGHERDIQSGAGWFLRVSPGYPFEEFPEPEEIETEFMENLALIVQAVNCHDELQATIDRLHLSNVELLAATKFLVVYAGAQVRRHPEATDTPDWQRLLDAIAKAEGRS